MDEMEILRRKVWRELRAVARPDSRFHWDFTAFIPDYRGSEACTEAIANLAICRQAQTLFITPDNNLASLRARCLREGKTIIVPTYAIRRGFWLLHPGQVPQGQEDFAATLDGLERFGTAIEPQHLAPDQAPQALVTGASVLNLEGVRLSPNPSYFDLEWLILRTLGHVDSETPVIASVHDCQLVDWPCQPHPLGCIADIIVTPTRVLNTPRHFSKPASFQWDQLSWNVIEEIPILARLHSRQLRQAKPPAPATPLARGQPPQSDPESPTEV